MRVLVTAASKHGSTREIAESLAESLARHGLEVTLLAPEDVSSLDGLDAVVMGSAVYAGSWMGTARQLIERNVAALSGRCVWLFSSGPLGDPPKPGEEPADAPTLVVLAGARDHRVFAGRLNEQGLGFGERAIVKLLHAPYGDFRDWAAISAWADKIAEELTQPATRSRHH